MTKLAGINTIMGRIRAVSKAVKNSFHKLMTSESNSSELEHKAVGVAIYLTHSSPLSSFCWQSCIPFVLTVWLGAGVHERICCTDKYFFNGHDQSSILNLEF